MSTELKKCSTCHELLPISMFVKDSSKKDGLRYGCKNCYKKYLHKNKEKLCNNSLRYREKNKEKESKRHSLYRKNNKDKVNAYQRKIRLGVKGDGIAEYHKDYRKNNHERIQSQVNNWHKNERKTNYVFSMRKRMSCLIGGALRKKGYAKKSLTFEILGCDYETFANHIESQFKDGMSWENRSEWHIDHIIPLASAKTESEVLALNHYTNLQPLWALDNIKKGAKMPS